LERAGVAAIVDVAARAEAFFRGIVGSLRHDEAADVQMSASNDDNLAEKTSRTWAARLLEPRFLHWPY
jgi:hypothetical protein